jgi:hypothetical protein
MAGVVSEEEGAEPRAEGAGINRSSRRTSSGMRSVATRQMRSTKISPYSWARTFRWAMIPFHGISGRASLKLAEARLAASPIT